MLEQLHAWDVLCQLLVNVDTSNALDVVMKVGMRNSRLLKYICLTVNVGLLIMIKF